MPVSLTRNGGENVPGNPGACATRNFTYLVRGPWMRRKQSMASQRMACPIRYAHYTFKYSLIMALYYYIMYLAVFVKWNKMLGFGSILFWAKFKGCVSLNPSKISKSGWWGLQLDAWQLCNSLWYGLINSKLHINKKIFFLYHTTSDGVTVQCFKSPSWPLRDGLDLWPQLIYTLSWESQHEEI